jgi:DNA (cytosine-5)-methyltransferase 1
MGTGSRNGQASVAVAYDLRGREGGAQLEGPHDTANIRAASGGSSRSYVAAATFSFDPGQSANPKATHQFCEEHTAPLIKERVHAVGGSMAVRRLTPRECERLQGFPDDYTLLGERTPDGPRYKALGNSMAVPVMAWIGKRIAAHEGGIHAE